MEWNAADYAQNASAQYAWAESLLGGLSFIGTEDILDLGCGDGRVTAGMARWVTGRVIGVDSAETMVCLAARQYAAVANLLFRQMDATRLRFEAEFDLVFSNAALHWVNDHRSVLAGVARALRPAGRVVLSMGGMGNAAGLLPVVDDMIQGDRWRAWFEDFVFPYAFYGIEDYAKWLPEAGLQADRVELVCKDMVHDNRGALKGWIRTTWFPFTHRVPQAQREFFIDELVAGYIERYPLDAFGRTHVQMMRLEVEATKV